MKILVLAPPIGAAGGIQNYTAALVRALREIDGEKNVRMVAVPAEATARADGKAALGRITKIRFLLNAITAAIFWRPKLIICTHVGVSTAARIIHRITRVPYWIWIHGIEVWSELSRPKVEALRGAQLLVANSKFTLESASARHGLEKSEAAFLSPTYSIN
jgi:hypothetical protein